MRTCRNNVDYLGEAIGWEGMENYISIEGVTMGIGKNMMLGKYQESTKMTIIVESVHKLAFLCNWIDDYLKVHVLMDPSSSN